MRVVTIDNGNTNPSVGFFSNGILTQVLALASYIPDPNDYILISSVGKKLSLKPSFDLKTKRTKSHFFDMPVYYSETLGEDRLVAAYSLFKKWETSNKKILVIDAGTFMTCDLVSSKGFEGGYIFPGISHFLKMYGESALLPVLSKQDLPLLTNDLPKETSEAILKASLIYLRSSLNSIIETTHPDRLVFTGGDGELIFKIINSSIPSEIDRHLIHLALSSIYQTQLSQD